MKVITYNLHKGHRGRGRRRRSIFNDAIAALEERRPDLLLCQEVFHGAADVLHQCHFITEVIGHQHVFGPNVFNHRGCHGNATFSRLPVANSLNIDATEWWLERRGMLRTWLEGPGGPLEVFNVHFSLTAGQRWRQWGKLLAALPEAPSIPVLVCGDFNDWTEAIDRWAARTPILHNALWSLPRRARPTFPAIRPLFALDRIYYRGLRPVSVDVLRGKPWSRLSDHLPIEAVFERHE